MNNNMYDSSISDNDFNFSNDSYIYDCDENNDVYIDDNYRKNTLPMNYANLQFRMDRIEEMLQTTCKKSKKHKKKKNKKLNKKYCNTKGKQYKKRLKSLEKQNADMMQYLAIMVQQPQSSDKYGWLIKCIERSAPNIVDLASNIVTSKRRPPARTLNQPLCLPDKSYMK